MSMELGSVCISLFPFSPFWLMVSSLLEYIQSRATGDAPSRGVRIHYDPGRSSIEKGQFYNTFTFSEMK